VAVPGRDRIVPPESALPLAGLIAGALLHQPAAGHVGMVAGASAERALWGPLQDWLALL
jgi:poly(3-hydroxyalkanoate) synthetase